LSFFKKYSYRILAENTSKGTVYSIHEVELNALEVPIRYNKLPISLIHTSLEDMIIELEEILNSYDEPVLSIESFPDPF
jgi:hypothetical protein